MQNDNVTIVTNFEQFVQKFEEMLVMTSEIDDCHSMNIAWFISMKVNCIIMWIYTRKAFMACNILHSPFYVSFESVLLLFTLLVISSLAFKVNNYSNL